MSIKYIKENNKIIKITEKREEIDELKLEKEISILKKAIVNIPKEKTKPDQETLDFWNENRPPTGINEMKEELTKKENLLNKIKEIK